MPSPLSDATGARSRSARTSSRRAAGIADTQQRGVGGERHVTCRPLSDLALEQGVLQQVVGDAVEQRVGTSTSGSRFGGGEADRRTWRSAVAGSPPHLGRQHPARLALRLLQLGQRLLQALGDLRQLALQQQIEPVAVLAVHRSAPDNRGCSAIAAGSSRRASGEHRFRGSRAGSSPAATRARAAWRCSARWRVAPADGNARPAPGSACDGCAG
jgi:hypothetical protein